MLIQRAPYARNRWEEGVSSGAVTVGDAFVDSVAEDDGEGPHWRFSTPVAEVIKQSTAHLSANEDPSRLLESCFTTPS